MSAWTLTRRTRWHPTEQMLARLYFCTALLLCGASGSAIAQPGEHLSLSTQIVSDYRLRGLSWSTGKPTIVASADIPVTTGNTIHVTTFAPRGAGRTGLADFGLRVGGRHTEFIGPVRANAGGSCRIFLPSNATSFCEIEAGASFDLAWVNIYTELAYAPPQSSIGGSNLYAVTGTNIAIPGSPVTVSSHVGHSSGATDDVQKASRLRPQSDYWDFGVGAVVTRGRLSLGARYFGTATWSGHDPRWTGGVVTEARIDF